MSLRSKAGWAGFRKRRWCAGAPLCATRLAAARKVPPFERKLTNAAGFQGAQFGGPLLALDIADVWVGQQAAARAIDESLEGLVAAGLFDGGRKLVGDDGEDGVEVELVVGAFGLGFQFRAESGE